MHVVLFEIVTTNITPQFGNLGCRGEDAPNHVRQVNNKEEENVIVQCQNTEKVHVRRMALKVWIPEFATNARVSKILRAKLKCMGTKLADVDMCIYTCKYLYLIGCLDTYPKNYVHSQCKAACLKMRNQGNCRKTWNQVLKGACRNRIPQWHRNRRINLYCRRTCGACGKRIHCTYDYYKN